jgi:hypothetical protein
MRHAKKPKTKRKPSPNRRTVTIPEAGEILGLSRESAYKAAAQEPPEIFTVRFGRRKLVPVAWLNKKLENADA